MQLVSVATIAAASIYSISTFRPLWSPSGQDVICAFFTAVWRTFTGHLSMNLNVFLVHSLTNHQCSGFPQHATCLPRVELAVSGLQHLFQMPCELRESLKDLIQASGGISHYCVCISQKLTFVLRYWRWIFSLKGQSLVIWNLSRFDFILITYRKQKQEK